MSVSGKKGKNMQSYYVNSGKRLSVEDVLEFPIVEVPMMSIIKEDAEYFDIRSEYSTQDGTTLVATYLPFYNQEDKLTGYKRRDWSKDKEEDGHFTVVGSIKTSSQLFGQNKCKPHGKSSIIYTEGEGDVVAARRGMLNSLKGTNWEGKIHPNVVGLPLGAGNATEATAHNELFLRNFAKIILAMDNDGATEGEKLKGIKKGAEATEDVASFLLTDNIYMFKFPDGIKDPREMLDKGLGVELGKGLSFNAVKFTPEKILSLRDINVKSLRKKKTKGIPFRHMPKLTEMTGGAVSSELWVATGPSGAGKSTLVRDMEFDIVEYLRKGLPEGSYNPDNVFYDEGGLPRLDGYTENERCGIIRLEEDEEESVNSLYAMDMRIDPKAFCGEPELFLTEEEHERLHNLWSEEDRIKIMDHFGSLPILSLISKLKQLVFMYNCKWIVLDHLSMLVSGLRGGDDRKELDIIMTELAAFCKQFDVFIIAVSHMKRKDFQPPKDDEGNNLPFFVPVRKEDLRGSAALEQLSWVVLLYEPEELPNRSRGRVRIVVGKNRRGKKLGNADTLWMNEDGTFTDASEWEIEGEYFMLGGEEVHCFTSTSVPVEVTKPPLQMINGIDEPF
tara:strand:+ start:302 stop:2146 length:1845 start_codon:yes stop_codon:yes gene_type:complete